MNRHRMNAKNPNLKAVHWKKNHLEKFAHDFAEIYNKAWANHGEGKQIEAKKVLKMFQTMKPILDENISWFIYENVMTNMKATIDKAMTIEKTVVK